jgi:hypothetical protein
MGPLLGCHLWVSMKWQYDMTNGFRLVGTISKWDVIWDVICGFQWNDNMTWQTILTSIGIQMGHHVWPSMKWQYDMTICHGPLHIWGLPKVERIAWATRIKTNTQPPPMFHKVFLYHKLLAIKSNGWMKEKLQM